MRPIDPVVIREKQDRQRARQHRERATRQSLDALGWFSKYALDGSQTGVAQVNPNALVGAGSLGSPKMPVLIVATSTVGIEDASHYVNAAFIEMRAAVLTRAIELAQEDLEANEVEERLR